MEDQPAYKKQKMKGTYSANFTGKYEWPDLPSPKKEANVYIFDDANITPKQEPLNICKAEMYIQMVDENNNIVTNKIDKSKGIEVKLGNSTEGLDILFDAIEKDKRKTLCELYREELKNVMEVETEINNLIAPINEI